MLYEACECYSSIHAEKDEQRGDPNEINTILKSLLFKGWGNKVYFSRVQKKKTTEPWVILQHLQPSGDTENTGFLAIRESSQQVIVAKLDSPVSSRETAQYPAIGIVHIRPRYRTVSSE